MVRKTFVIRLTILLCTIFLMMPATAEVVHIPDVNLRAAINKTLNKPSDAPIGKSEILNLTQLNVADIRTLTGLEHATNLTELSLVGKHLTIEERDEPSIRTNYLIGWNGNNYPSGKANYPVIGVSWYAAMAYAKWAGKRLPT